MAEAKRIAEQHRRAYHGDAWHGPSVFEALRGVTAATAARRPIAGAHTIWELVLHLTSWERIVRSRVEGEPIEYSQDLDWPAMPRPTASAWKAAREELEAASDELRKAIRRMTDRKLRTKRAGATRTYYDLAHGQVQHALYHAGQISLLRKTR